MLIRKYRAKNLKDALRQVKAELGDSATILNTRTVPAGLLGSQLEVTATLAPQERGPAARKESLPAAAPPPQVPSLELQDVARFLAPLRREIRALHREVKTFAGGPATGRVESAIDELTQLLRGLQRDGGAPPPRDTIAQNLAPAAQADGVERLVAEKLIASGMRESVARRVVARLAAALPEDPEEALFCREAVTARLIGADLRCVDPVELASGPRVVALVGPPGVGKTTTLAKIATRAALIHGRSVGVVGCDSERIGAVQALRELGELIGVPVRIATDPARLRAALEELEGCELILIDTSGCSARNPAELEQLERLLGAGVEPLLLINADMRGLEIDATLRGFDRIHPRALVFTKCDAAMGLGALYEAATDGGLPVIYLTNGRKIPEDIEDATPERIASLILGFRHN